MCVTRAVKLIHFSPRKERPTADGSLLNLWRNFDGLTTSLNDLHFDFAIIHAVICQLFVKNFILSAVKLNSKEMKPIFVYIVHCDANYSIFVWLRREIDHPNWLGFKIVLTKGAVIPLVKSSLKSYLPVRYASGVKARLTIKSGVHR